MKNPNKNDTNGKIENKSWSFLAYQFLDKRAEFTGRLELLEDKLVANEAAAFNSDSFQFIENLSSRGLFGATIILGDKYRDGRGCIKDYERAEECYSNAAYEYMGEIAIERIKELNRRRIEAERKK